MRVNPRLVLLVGASSSYYNAGLWWVYPRFASVLLLVTAACWLIMTGSAKISP